MNKQTLASIQTRRGNGQILDDMEDDDDLKSQYDQLESRTPPSRGSKEEHMRRNILACAHLNHPEYNRYIYIYTSYYDSMYFNLQQQVHNLLISMKLILPISINIEKISCLFVYHDVSSLLVCLRFF